MSAKSSEPAGPATGPTVKAGGNAAVGGRETAPAVAGRYRALWKKVAVVAATFSPGIFLIGYNIGTGSVTTMATAGAGYGMMMVWPLLLSCIFTCVLIVTFGRFTAVTGDTALHAFRKYFGSGLAMFVMLTLLFSEWVSCMGVMAVVCQVVQEWSRPLTSGGEGFNTIILAAVFGGMLYAFFWNGKHRFFEFVLSVFVAVMGISFILSMIMVIPDPMEVIRGLVPALPRDSDAALLMAGMVGTTMGAILFVVRSILVQEKGWGVNDLRLEKRDAFFSAAVMFVLSVAIMASAAGTLHPRGLRIENAIDMVVLLEPIAGRFAISIFVAGIVSAGLSSLFPIILLAPWLFADYRNRPRDMRSTTTRLLVLWGVLLGFAVPLFGGRPVIIMIASQAGCAIVSPLVVLLMMILQNRKDVLGEHRAGTGLNLWLGIIFLFTLVIAVLGVIGVVALFKGN